jgi:hypothetical protein
MNDAREFAHGEMREVRTYVRRGHAGVSLGFFATAALGVLALGAAMLAVKVVLLVAPLVLAVAVIDWIGRRQRRPSLRIYRAPHLDDDRPQWVERDRWPHAVRAGSRLARR